MLTGNPPWSQLSTDPEKVKQLILGGGNLKENEDLSFIIVYLNYSLHWQLHRIIYKYSQNLFHLSTHNLIQILPCILKKIGTPPYPSDISDDLRLFLD